MVLISFIAFLLLFVLIGVLSVKKRKKNSQDYLLAGQSVKPWLVALSAVATNNSGYMFIGQIGFTYLYGLQSIWLMVGWILGDFFTSFFVHKNLRIQTEKQKSLSFSDVISRWHGAHFKYLSVLSALITLVFLGVYAAAQLKAGSKALHVLFDWNLEIGAVIGAVIVVLYCFAGGIRASIWTDVAQSFVMLFAMIVMLIFGVMEVGGLSSLFVQLTDISPTYMNWFAQTHPWGDFFGPIVFVIGWFFAGVGVIGQPHIMVRFMALESPDLIQKTRAYYYGWFTFFFAITIATAMVARLLIPEIHNFDSELALPLLADSLLPDILVGMVLAGLFAATISTADSQILSCTAVLTHDLLPAKHQSYLINKMATLLMVCITLLIALYGSDNVFNLVLIAWSALGSAFAPLLILYVLKIKIPQWIACSMMIGGVGVMLIWRLAGLNNITYEILPGILTGFLIWLLFSKISRVKVFNK